jgi:hypothetical protein
MPGGLGTRRQWRRLSLPDPPLLQQIIQRHDSAHYSCLAIAQEKPGASAVRKGMPGNG